ncbi:MAG TPA: trigger factor, partial [Acidimicrobiales bacterium]|nr:trigger factor [Acidimicrobiales bacterium]
MKSTVEPLDGNRVKLSVEVDEGEFDKAVDAALRKISRQVRIPGFRPGKAPRRLLEARMGRAGVRQEAMKEALPVYYAEALRQCEVDAIAPPEIDIVSGEDDGPLAFDAVVQVRPSVSILGYQGLRVTLPAPVATDEEIRRQIDRQRQSFGQLEVAERAAGSGDYVTIDVTATSGGEPVGDLSRQDYLYEVGSGGLTPDLDARLEGASAGDTLEFEAHGTEGDVVAFEVQVKEVKGMVLPEVTDEWAGEVSEFETVAELEDDLRQSIVRAKRIQARMRMRDEAVRALVELVDEEVPEPLVNAEMERRLRDLAGRLNMQGANLGQYLEATGQSQEQLIASLRHGALDGVKADLALRALADAEGIEATDDDIDAELATAAGRLEQDQALLRRQLEDG